ncbi:C39 family peptidase [Nafulsella turpanensis]|uniref:C39 family peptidase n=1 Tax=Nafulsella turpanensis TaxID=1265690 RepID=UPI00034887BF|nr:C39 family peptidase [Nafulsella turpanensis]
MSKFKILPQPDDTTCGPTSLHAVYTFFRYTVNLDEVIGSVNYLEEGGTLAVFLGLDAISKGFEAKIYTYNLKMFDPSWKDLSKDELLQKLDAQLAYKKGKKFAMATQAYKQFLQQGGQILFENLDEDLLKSYLHNNIPILAGLSATYLYQSKREFTNSKNQSIFDDLKGEPMGHFVVLTRMEEDHVWVADPYKENPISQNNYYKIEIKRLINAVHLGILTYDANILIVAPKKLL